ncbi:MAG: hypothetical protein NC489_24925 [Ruminococcus flavefaciens]|nr:hypothetical protein [Ruminococcus flavefaciens]
MGTGNKFPGRGDILKKIILLLSIVALLLFYAHTAYAAEPTDFPDSGSANAEEDKDSGSVESEDTEDAEDAEDTDESQTADSPSIIFSFTAPSGTIDTSGLDGDSDSGTAKEIMLYTDSADYSEQLATISEQLLLVSEQTATITEQLSSMVEMLTYISGILIFFVVASLCKYAYSFFNIFF